MGKAPLLQTIVIQFQATPNLFQNLVAEVQSHIFYMVDITNIDICAEMCISCLSIKYVMMQYIIFPFIVCPIVIGQ